MTKPCPEASPCYTCSARKYIFSTTSAICDDEVFGTPTREGSLRNRPTNCPEQNSAAAINQQNASALRAFLRQRS